LFFVRRTLVKLRGFALWGAGDKRRDGPNSITIIIVIISMIIITIVVVIATVVDIVISSIIIIYSITIYDQHWYIRETLALRVV
jgi:hypothetical protein